MAEKPDESGIRYVKEIVDSMAKTNPRDYLDSILLMVGETEEGLENKYDTSEIRDLFIEGLVVNRVVSLAEFGRTMML